MEDASPLWAERNHGQDGKADRITPTGSDGQKLRPVDYGPDPTTTFRPDIPSPARMYDYALGGKDNLPVDREAAEEVIKAMPPGLIRTAARQNRSFMQRAVRHIVTETDVRQFIDIGSGMPTMGPVHEIAQAIDPASHVVYIDYDPLVIPHSWEMLSGIQHATVLHHDLRDPEEIYADPELRRLIDFERPVALLLVAVLPFISDEEDPRGIVRRLLNALPAGSHLVLSHGTADVTPEVNTAARVWDRAMSRVHNRSKAEIAELFGGLDIIDPGLVWIPQWRPDPDTGLQDAPHRALFYGAVARKP